MPRLDHVGGIEPNAAGDLRAGQLDTQGEHLRGLDHRPANHPVFVPQTHLDDARRNLEGKSLRRGIEMSRQDEGGTDHRMAGKGISWLRLKMRTRAEWAGSSGGSTKVVSLRLSSAARRCMSSAEMPSAWGKTASGLPPKRRSVKTSTVSKR